MGQTGLRHRRTRAELANRSSLLPLQSGIETAGEIPLDTLRRACSLTLNMFRRRSRGLSASRACVFNPNRG